MDRILLYMSHSVVQEILIRRKNVTQMNKSGLGVEENAFW